MNEVIFRNWEKGHFKEPNGIDIKVGDCVICKLSKGEKIGEVVRTETAAKRSKGEVLRRCTEADIKIFEENKKFEERVYSECKKGLKEIAQPIKLAFVEYQFDHRKLTFYFTAAKRINFKSIVEYLSKKYSMNIGVHQIGVREHARLHGGLGPCGRDLCCRTFLSNFQPVSIRTVKEQNLSLSMLKMAGACGRLACCLAFERDYYVEELKKYPPIGTPVTTERGKGVVSTIDIFKERIFIKYEDGIEEGISKDGVKIGG